jgi:peroxiredoxin Q/BCP
VRRAGGIAVGARAPEFTLNDGLGQEWRLRDQRGKTVVLFFYPGDETPICTRQLCSVRDRWEDYMATGAEVVAISTNTVESHKAFAEHYNLPLRLLADTDGQVRAAYGAFSMIPNKTARSVFVIDPAGIIRYRKVQPLGLFRPKDDDIIEEIKKADVRGQGSGAG